MKKNKIDFVYLREPGGSSNSEKIRKLILSKKTKFQPKTDLLLYIAARNENISILRKNYKKRIILIDRFVDSTVAYQHYGMGLNISFIKTFLVRGNNKRKPKASVTNPGIIKRKAAKAIDAPEIIS